MTRNLGYILTALIILSCLLGPALCKQKLNSPRPDNDMCGEPGSYHEGSPAVKSGNGGSAVESTYETVSGEIKPESSSAGSESVKNFGPLQKPKNNLPPEGSRSGLSGSDLLPADSQEGGLEGAVPAAPAGGSVQVAIAVVGMKGVLIYGPANVVVNNSGKWGLTVLGALDAAGLDYSLSAVHHDLVFSIAGQSNKGMCGWMYKVNGEVAMIAAGAKRIAHGDKIIWWYSESIDNPGPSWESLGF
ncbi:MAG: DUF4430 domain-containing protein [Bacillota bacterium]